MNILEHASNTQSASVSVIAAFTNPLPESQRPVEYYISFKLWFTEHTVCDQSPLVNIVSSQACKSAQLISTVWIGVCQHTTSKM